MGVYICVRPYYYDGNGEVIEIGYQVKNGDTLGILNRNPLRYRGYYYDSESNFYYLNARYYDPVTHRFINADNQIVGVSGDVSGYDLFEYCNNNPVKLTDASGEWPEICRYFFNKIFPNRKGTFTASLELEGEVLIVGGYVALNRSFDLYGNTELSFSYAATGINDTMNAGWCYGSASESVSITNYETVFGLEGYGSAGSIDYGMLPKHYGVDLVMDGDGAPKGIGGLFG